MGSYSEKYTDGATGANNPIRYLWNEACDVLLDESEKLEENLDCILSIGTGEPKIEAFGESLRELAKSLAAISTETEETAKGFYKDRRDLVAEHRYCRLNVLNGLQDVGLEEHQQKDHIMAVTHEYLDSPMVNDYLKNCTKKASEHEFMNPDLAVICARDRPLVLYDRQKSGNTRMEDISDYDHTRKHRVRSSKRISGTATWILKHQQFCRWVENTSPSTFVVSGTGIDSSTVLNESRLTQIVSWLWKDDTRVPILPITSFKASTYLFGRSSIIDHVGKTQRKLGRAILHYYCEHLPQNQTSALDIMRSFVRQTTEHLSMIRKRIPADLAARIEDAFSVSRRLLTNDRVAPLLKELMELASQSIFVIDAIDVLQEADIFAVAKVFRHINASQSSKLCILSRETVGRGIDLKDLLAPASLLNLTLPMLRKDIACYVDEQVHERQRERAVAEDPSLLTEIKEKLKENSEKMFLWIELQILNIWQFCANDSEVRLMLNNLPEGLEETYIQCLERVDSDSICRRYAPRILKWVAFAQRPLTPREAREAASMNRSELRLDTSSVLNNSVTSCCANLITMDLSNRGIRFTHPSVEIFLRDASKVPAKLSRYVIRDEQDLVCGQICMAYLIAANRRKQLSRRDPVSVTLPTNTFTKSFLPKSTSTFLHKVRGRRSLSATQSVTLPFKTEHNAAPPDANFEIHHYVRLYWLDHVRSINFEAQHFQRFRDLCLEERYDCHPWSDGDCSILEFVRGAIEHAVLKGHRPLLELFLQEYQGPQSALREKLGKLIALPGIRTRIPLMHIAATLGHDKIIQLLLPLVDLDRLDDYYRTALACAAAAGHRTIVEVLIEKGQASISNVGEIEVTVDVSPYGWPESVLRTTRITLDLLSMLSYDGHTEMVAWLLEQRVLPIFKVATAGISSFRLGDAFVLASLNNHRKIAQILVEAGTHPDFAHGSITTAPPLIYATKVANLTMVECLLKLGASPNVIDKNGYDPLHWVLARIGQEDVYQLENIVQKLLANDIPNPMKAKAAVCQSWIRRLISWQEDFTGQKMFGFCLILRRIVTECCKDSSAPTTYTTNIASLIERSKRLKRLKDVDMFYKWLEFVPDDIGQDLFVKLRWIDTDLRTSKGETILHALARRPTATLLEALHSTKELPEVSLDSSGRLPVEYALKHEYHETAAFFFMHPKLLTPINVGRLESYLEKKSLFAGYLQYRGSAALAERLTRDDIGPISTWLVRNCIELDSHNIESAYTRYKRVHKHDQSLDKPLTFPDDFHRDNVHERWVEGPEANSKTLAALTSIRNLPS